MKNQLDPLALVLRRSRQSVRTAVHTGGCRESYPTYDCGNTCGTTCGKSITPPPPPPDFPIPPDVQTT
ncbi:MAG: hypothetical protein U0174_27355 [Polyangiaceae bacterium]